jgi:hypothetical protein
MKLVERGSLRIRNRRYRPWSAAVGLALLACPLFTLALMLVYPPLNTQATARFVIVSMLGVAAYSGYNGLLILDLQRGPRPSRWQTARAVCRWAVFRVRDKVLDPVPAQAIALAAFDWVLPTRLWVHGLKVGGGIELEPNISFAPAAVRAVRFAPDPAEDYVEPGHPARFCLAAVELDTGRHLRLIVDETDAELLRHWATAKEITVAHGDGYQPRPTEPTRTLMTPSSDPE